MRNILIFGVVLSVLGCQSEVKIDTQLLDGEWIIEDAMRDGKQTSTLDGLLFSFDEDELSTNLSGELVSDQFEIKDSQIVTAQDDQSYSIINLDSTHLTLSTNLLDSEFQFTFNRDTEVH